MVKVVNSKELKQFLEKMKQDYKIAAPVVNEKGKKKRVEYKYIDNFEDIYLEKQPDSSIKSFFLPQNEKMGSESEKTLIFGVRSCDIEAVKVTDAVFLDEYYLDSDYKKRRENTVIIGYSCPEKQPTCFCTGLGINPVENEAVPIYLFQVGDKYWFKVYDQEYEYLVKDLPDGDESELEELIKNRNRNESFNSNNNFEVELPEPLPEETTFSASFWDDIAEKCLGCGICTYYCPTCYCFGFFWDGEGEEAEKWRGWDSCMFSLYTKHASGHNPREDQSQRYRQRVMHKFSYHPENYEGLACVGCGRCIRECPVNLDIREALKTTENYLKEKGGAE